MLTFILVAAACTGAIALGFILVIIMTIEVVADWQAKRRRAA